MPSLSKITAGDTEQDGANLPITISDDAKTEELCVGKYAEELVNNEENCSNEEKIEVGGSKGIELGGAELKPEVASNSTETSQQSDFDKIKAEYEHQKTLEIRITQITFALNIIHNAITGGPQGTISAITKIIEGPKIEKIETRYDNKIANIGRAFREDSAIERCGSMSSEERSDRVQELKQEIHTLNDISKSLSKNTDKETGEINMEKFDNWIERQMEKNDDFAKEMDILLEKYDCDNYTELADKLSDVAIGELKQELRDIEIAEKFDDAQEKFGSLSNEERSSELNNAQNTIDAIYKEMSNRGLDRKEVPEDLKDKLLEAKEIRDDINMLNRHDDIENFRESGSIKGLF